MNFCPVYVLGLATYSNGFLPKLIAPILRSLASHTPQSQGEKGYGLVSQATPLNLREKGGLVTMRTESCSTIITKHVMDDRKLYTVQLCKLYLFTRTRGHRY